MSLDDLSRDPTAAWAISRTIKLEGGWVDNPADPGGATNYGVSLRFALQEAQVHPDIAKLIDVDHDGHVTPADIRQMTQDQAAAIYYEAIWKPGPYARLIPPVFVAWKVFDIAVNTGPKRAGLILQDALTVRGHALIHDGVIGEATIRQVQVEVQRDGGAGLLSQLRTCQAAFYQGLAAAHPKMQVFLHGWLRRASA